MTQILLLLQLERRIRLERERMTQLASVGEEDTPGERANDSTGTTPTKTSNTASAASIGERANDSTGTTPTKTSNTASTSVGERIFSTTPTKTSNTASVAERIFNAEGYC
nr:hypothetical protein Itr_chr13CG00850 [Ipomoea trifida]